MLTVLMASRNGAPTLPRVLEAYLALQDPPGGWKFVVVDNASNDGTGDLVNGFANRLPIKLVHEPRPGKNRALNTGLQFTIGDLVVFTDDDTVPRPDWLVQMRRVADEQPDFTIFAGRIEPIWPGEPPDWFFRVVPLGCTFAKTADDLATGPVPPLWIAGANMAVRKRVFDAGYRFDEAMGPQPGQYCMGSEGEFTTRLSRLGFRSYHHNASHVGHIVRPHQMQPEWIIKRANRFGRGMFRVQGQELSRGTPSLFGVPRWMVRRFVQELVKLIAAKARGDVERRFAAEWQVQYYLGYLAEACQAQRTRRSGPAAPSIGFGDARQ